MSETRVSLLFLTALAAYFAAQAGLRIALGGSFEGDEAEMVVLARDWHLAFGSQPPLYNWYQTLFFDLFGVGTAGLMAAKNLALFATYAITFAALRPISGARLAMAGTLALALIPNLAWWAQRTGSHSIALAAMTAVTLAAFLHLLRHPGRRAFLLFGVAMGLGGLAKPNYWLVPPALILAGLTIAPYRKVLLDRRLALSALVAVAVIALPYGLMLASPRATFSDVWEFRKGAEAMAGPLWPQGLGRMGAGGLAELALLLILAVVMRLFALRRWPAPQDPERLMLRAALIGMVLVALGVVAADITLVRARWLLPLFMLAAPAVAIILFREASTRALRNYLVVMAGLAALLLTAIADTRLRGAGSDSLRIDLLAEAIEADLGEVPLILGPHYYTGNLLLHRPDWQVLPPFPTTRLAAPEGQLLVIGGDEDSARGWFHEQGYPKARPPAPVARFEAVLPYRFTDGETRRVPYMLYDFGTGAAASGN